MEDYKNILSWGAKPGIFTNARNLRKSMTESEKLLWGSLRNRQLNGMKFRRQHPLDIFIADFYCHEKKLVIELDGEIHDKKEQMEYDDGRSFELEEKGFKILRFRNEEVINDIQSVLKRIIEATT
jgi:very-short-patch-repair endonuclease